MHASKESSISVAVRVRPFTDTEQHHLIREVEENPFQSSGALASATRGWAQPKGLRKILNVVDDRMLIFDPPETNQLNSMANNALSGQKQVGRVNNRIREHRFIFDKLFDEDASQEDVYNGTTKNLLESVLDGFNATVFAYGATGCGKTHTITGTPDSPGIIFATMKELFAKVEEMKSSHEVELTLSYLEIYNETIRDLLSTEGQEQRKRLHIREDAHKKITVSNLSSFKPESVDQVMDLILTGNANRTISPTEANLTSSRSHAVLQINLDTRPKASGLTEEHRYATFSIIDLAGSERASSTKNTGERLHEGANINKSLLALGNCINALCDPRRRNHIPYRDSKLTRLLKFSLGGNCKTVMIVCVSPSSSHYDETLNTLKYANRAKEIKTKVIRNQHNLSRHVGSYLKMITEQKAEIDNLRARESKIVEQTLKRAAMQREKVQKLLLERLDEITLSIEKHASIQRRKAFVLAKRKILTILRQQIDSFLKSFDSAFSSHGDLDISEFDSVVPGFGSMINKAETLLTKFIIEIEELEKEYTKETVIDYILGTSAEVMGKKLGEFEGWTSYDSVNFELHLDRMKSTVERDVLYESSVYFDQSSSALESLQFPLSNFMYLLNCCIQNDVVKVDSLKSIVSDLSSKFDNLLKNDIQLNISQVNMSLRPRISLSPQKKKKGSKRSPSPLNKSPIKISKPRSPVRKQKVKKVRWEIPSSSSAAFDDDKDASSATASADSDACDGDDVEMKDTPLHERLWNKMNISPPKSDNGAALKKLSIKQRSLASMKLIPPEADNNKSSNVVGDSHVSFIGSLSPSRQKVDLGPPQRIFQPLRPISEDSQALSDVSNTTSLRVDDKDDATHKKSKLSTGTFSDSVVESSTVSKEDNPIPSLFGDISSIF